MKNKRILKRAFTTAEFLIIAGFICFLAIVFAFAFSGSSNENIPNNNVNIENVAVDENPNYDYVNLAAHTHNYNQKNLSDAYIASYATCSSPAKYYFSCTCGAKGTSTFDYGNAQGHDFTSRIIHSNYLNSPASCIFGASYYYSCTTCGIKGDELFFYGDPDMDNHIGNAEVTYSKIKNDNTHHNKHVVCDACTYDISTTREAHDLNSANTCTKCEYHAHDYNQRVVSDLYVKKQATCTSAGEYYFSCVCGEAGSESFTSGSAVGHAFTNGVMNNYYLKEIANCAHGNIYYKSCMYCGMTGTETFDDGQKDLSVHTGGTKYLYEKLNNSMHLKLTVCTQCETPFKQEEEAHLLDAERNCTDCDVHIHSFNKQITTIIHLKSEATCTSPAVYYKSCVCDENGTETFTSGNKVSHDYQNIEKDEYIKTYGTCTTKTIYYKSCRFCGLKGTETFTSKENVSKMHTGNIVFKGTQDFHQIYDCCGAVYSIEHVFTKEVEIPATCTYWGASRHTCICGYSFLEFDIPYDYSTHSGRVIYGEGNAEVHTLYTCCGATASEQHTFDKNVVADKYFVSEATCINKTKYYKSCACGYTDKSLTFDHGSKNPNNHVGQIVNGATKNCHKKCNACNATVENGSCHTYSVVTAITATCVEKGTSRYTCDCGYSYDSKEIAINPNNHAGDTIYAGTETAHKKCSACNATLEDASKHSFKQSVYVAETCTVDGKTKYTCACGYYYVLQNIPKLGHDKTAQPTWGNGHKTATVQCARAGCTQTWSGNSTEVTTVVATCVIKRQYYHTVEIDVGGTIKTYKCGNTHTGNALGHIPNDKVDWSSNHAVATVICTRAGCTQTWSGNSTEVTTRVATCTITRQYYHSATFNVNGVSKTFKCDNTHESAALGHIDGPAATCTSAQECQRAGCGAVITSSLGHIPATTATWNSGHTVATVKCTRAGCTTKWSGVSSQVTTRDATCTITRQYYHSATFSVNGVSKTFKCSKTHTGTALGHAPQTTPTWNEDHTVATVECTRSGCSTTWQGNSTESTTVVASCTAGRRHYHTTTFSVNGTNKTFECGTTHIGTPLGHYYNTLPSFSWSTGHTQCTASVACARDCGYVLKETKAATQSTLSNATCTQDGNYTCYAYFASSEFGTVNCSSNHTISALGHVMNEETKDNAFLKSNATCTTPKLYYYNCSRSGCNVRGSETFADGSALGHDYTRQNTDNSYLYSLATCTAKAKYYYSCTRCGLKGDDKFEFGSKLSHSYTEETVSNTYLKSAANCISAAVYYKNCSHPNCDVKGTATFTHGQANGHTFNQQHVDSKHLKSAATCTVKATYYYSCKDCDANDTKTFVNGNLKEHTKSAAATCKTSQTCTVCKTVIVDKSTISHTAGSAATCQSAQTCTVCGKELAAKKSCWDSVRYTYASEVVMAAAALHNKHTWCNSCGKELDVTTEHHGGPLVWYVPPAWQCQECGWLIY